MALWLAGEPITAGALNSKIPQLEPDEYATNAGGNTTTSATYTSLTGNPAVVAAASGAGKLRIGWGATCAPGATTIALMSVEVREGATLGAGTVVLASSDDRAVIWNSSEGSGSFEYELEGLNPLAFYNIRTVYKRFSGAGTPNFLRRWIRAWSGV